MAQLISTGLASLIARDSLPLTGTGGVSLPIVDFGRRCATVDARREDREQAYIAYEITVLGVLRDVEDALARIDAERRRGAALTRAVVNAEASEEQLRWLTAVLFKAMGGGRSADMPLPDRPDR